MGGVKIPKSQLGQLLELASKRQAEMTEMLTSLEAKAAGHTSSQKPGGWRQHPMEWWRSIKGVITSERSKRH
jgi:hypothetical protein